MVVKKLYLGLLLSCHISSICHLSSLGNSSLASREHSNQYFALIGGVKNRLYREIEF